MLKQKVKTNDRLKKSGVYRVKCDDCEHFYIGETGRTVSKRIQEHRNKNNPSAFGKHLLDHGHRSKNDENVKILHQCKKGIQLTLLEAYEIWRARNQTELLNEQVHLYKEPLFMSIPTRFEANVRES